jgi:glycosyltransferase involved in cell wall biosynthesis
MSVTVCIDARFTPGGSAGGVEPAARSLLGALAALGGDERYVVLAPEHWDQIDGLTFERFAPPPEPSRLRATVKRSVPFLHELWRRLPAVRFTPSPVPDEPSAARGADVVHFAFQSGFLTATPSIYQPWDLQHVHLPELFSERERAVREHHYRTLCAQAEAIVVATSWARADLIEHYGLAPERVHVVPPAAPTTVVRAAAAPDVPRESFALYPAQTYPHKNHLRLLEALALLRSRGVRVPVLCPGHRSDFYARIARRVRALHLDDQVTFCGYVPTAEMRALYARARMVVFPTLFEGFGFPVLEAMAQGVPVVCSNVTSLPSLLAGAGVVFDPRDVEEMAAAIERVWTDEDLRGRLASDGPARAAQFDWDRTARLFRAHYRRVGGAGLTAEDEALLAAPPPV